MSDENTSGENITVFILDPDNPPPMTPKRRAMIERLKAMKDEDIDFSDAPEHDFKLMPMHRVNPRAQPRRAKPAKAEVEKAEVQNTAR